MNTTLACATLARATLARATLARALLAAFLLASFTAAHAQKAQRYVYPDGRIVYSATPLEGARAEGDGKIPPPPSDPELDKTLRSDTRPADGVQQRDTRTVPPRQTFAPAKRDGAN